GQRDCSRARVGAALGVQAPRGAQGRRAGSRAARGAQHALSPECRVHPAAARVDEYVREVLEASVAARERTRGSSGKKVGNKRTPISLVTVRGDNNEHSYTEVAPHD